VEEGAANMKDKEVTHRVHVRGEDRRKETEEADKEEGREVRDKVQERKTGGGRTERKMERGGSTE
jgi:hypothetical protein